MIASLKPYSEYKETGLPWLGSVPLNWSVVRAKWLFRNTKILNTGMRNSNVLSLTLRGVVNNDPNDPEGLVPRDYESYQLFKKGDLVFKLIDLENLSTSRVGLVHEDGIMSPAYVRLIPKNPDETDYYFVQFFDLYSRGVYNQLGAGVRSTLGAKALLDLTLCRPPPDEQAAIVRFIGYANACIDKAIRANRKLIVLLNEQKQAIINRAITRGIDSRVIVTSSGVPWLGDIPTHWRTSRSKRLFSARKEFAKPDDVQLSATQAYGVIPQADFESKVNRRVVKISMHLDKRRHVKKNDFVISMRSFQGGLERAWSSGAIRSSYVVLKPEVDIDVEFFSYLFKSRGYIGALQTTAEFIRDGQDLNFDNFRSVDLPVVPLTEQKEIAHFITNATTNINKASANLEREITLLREYRTRLISDVVTGKLDVRGVVVPEIAADVPDEDAIAGDLDEAELTEASDE